MRPEIMFKEGTRWHNGDVSDRELPVQKSPVQILPVPLGVVEKKTRMKRRKRKKKNRMMTKRKTKKKNKINS